MAALRLSLLGREPIADGTMAFHFGKPAHFHFTAGQALDLTLIAPPQTDGEGNTRTFTIASGPQDDDLMIATRLRDTAFKRVLASVPIGTEVQAEGPDGSFTLQQDASRPAVFLTGGIGITPFRSMIRDAVARKLVQPMWLFYSNNRPEDAAFVDELQRLADQTPSLHFVPTMTDMARSHRNWHGETGLIDRDMISRRLPLVGPRYYLAGPPAMVTAMRTMLRGADVGDADIQVDEFSGY
jgi:ferredoxin-NADP reductase